MIVNPTVNDLLKNIENRYALVIVAGETPNSLAIAFRL